MFVVFLSWKITGSALEMMRVLSCSAAVKNICLVVLVSIMKLENPQSFAKSMTTCGEVSKEALLANLVQWQIVKSNQIAPQFYPTQGNPTLHQPT